MSTSDLIKALAQIRNELRSLEQQEKAVRARLIRKLDQQGTNSITIPHYKLTRSWTVREIMKKANTPAQIWNRYATLVEMETLRVKPR
jgi:hypothetical protein